MRGIPANKVGEIVQGYIDEGAVRVDVKADEGGTYTITAHA